MKATAARAAVRPKSAAFGIVTKTSPKVHEEFEQHQISVVQLYYDEPDEPPTVMLVKLAMVLMFDVVPANNPDNPAPVNVTSPAPDMAEDPEEDELSLPDGSVCSATTPASLSISQSCTGTSISFVLE